MSRRSLRDLAAGDLTGRRVLMRVDYNVPLGRDSTEPPIAVESLTARVPLPTGWRVESVAAVSPVDGEGLGIEWSAGAGDVVLKIPTLRLYKAIRIQCRKEVAP